jgi:hypothetical protein
VAGNALPLAVVHHPGIGKPAKVLKSLAFAGSLGREGAEDNGCLRVKDGRSHPVGDEAGAIGRSRRSRRKVALFITVPS